MSRLFAMGDDAMQPLFLFFLTNNNNHHHHIKHIKTLFHCGLKESSPCKGAAAGISPSQDGGPPGEKGGELQQVWGKDLTPRESDVGSVKGSGTLPRWRRSRASACLTGVAAGLHVGAGGGPVGRHAT